MFLIKEYTDGPSGFPSLINYFEFVSEGVVLNRDGSLLGCFYYSGPDMDSSLGQEEDQLVSQINGIFQTFGNGWSVHFDLIRIPAIDYPKENHFDNPTSLLIENKRRTDYEKEGEHFENTYVVSFCFLPSVVENEKVNSIFVINSKKEERTKMDFVINLFNQKLAEFEGSIGNRIHIKRMESLEVMTFLHRCISGQKQIVPVPNPPCYLNHYLGAHEFVAGHELMVDDNHVGVITLTQFPYENFSGILSILSALPFEYRFSTRFRFYDPIDALNVVNQYQGKYMGMVYNVWQTIMGAFGKDPRQDPDAANRAVLSKIEETKRAQEAIELSQVNFGYATFVVLVFDKSKDQCKRKMEYIRDLLNNNRLPAIIEKSNSVEAFLGSFPGDIFRNIRKPFISTLNLANMVALTDIWSGYQYNPCPLYPKNSPPLFYAATSGTTPFRFSAHVEDVGHGIALGSTGSGKSTLLSLILNSALRYPGSNVFSFDNGFSQFALTHALGGKFYNIMGEDDELSFCPLSELEDPAVQKWACGWIETIVTKQGVIVTPIIRSAIDQAIRDTSKSKSKSLSDFYLNLQNDEIKEALKQFVQIKDGFMSSLLDAKEDVFKAGRFQTFEISSLLALDKRLSTPVLLYLFHKIERSLKGQPAYIIIDEGWRIMLDETFMTYWIEFLRTLRKKNACVILATQSLSDIVNSPYVSIINENCFTKIFLPNPTANDPDSRSLYEAFGLNDRKIQIISEATPKKEYYVVSRDIGQRLIDLKLSPLELAFYGVGTMLQDRQKIKELQKEFGDRWVAKWLEIKGFKEEAEEWLLIKGEQERSNEVQFGNSIH
jgi:type IV secretion system protein VirB4